jgi:hypothetical protein
MECFVHRQNIEHYREILKTLADPTTREKIKNYWPKKKWRYAKQNKNTKN